MKKGEGALWPPLLLSSVSGLQFVPQLYPHGTESRLEARTLSLLKQ